MLMMLGACCYRNEVPNDGGEGGAGASNEPSSILAGGAIEQPSSEPQSQETTTQNNPNSKQENKYDWLPEKFRVQTSDGLDIDPIASAQKMAASYDGLSKRLGTGDIPPKSAEEYELNIESDALNFEDFKKDPDNQAFLSKAHEHGLTSKQLEFVLNEYAQVMPKAFERFKGLTEEQATAELSETWKTEPEFKAHLKDAFAAFNKYASPADKERIDEIGNNPVVIRLLANMGKNLREDSPVINNTGITSDSVEGIMKSDAYRNPNHPDYKSAQQKVRQYYESTFK